MATETHPSVSRRSESTSNNSAKTASTGYDAIDYSKKQSTPVHRCTFDEQNVRRCEESASAGTSESSSHDESLVITSESGCELPDTKNNCRDKEYVGRLEYRGESANERCRTRASNLKDDIVCQVELFKKRGMCRCLTI